MPEKRVLGPVERIEIYKNDVVVKRKGKAPVHDPVARGEIIRFSDASRKRLAFVASNTDVVFTCMVTLTYPAEFPSDGRKVKRDLRAFLDWMRRDQHNPHYLWFLEFQRRGAPHVHILFDLLWPLRLEERRGLYRRVAMTWYRIVGSKDRKHLAAGTRTERLRSPEGGARYAIKYAIKMRQKAVPREYRSVGRFWGCSSEVRPQVKSTYRCTEDDVRGVLEGWDYAPQEQRPIYRVLYNTADRFREYVGEVDNPAETCYNGAERH